MVFDFTATWPDLVTRGLTVTFFLYGAVFVPMFLIVTDPAGLVAVATAVDTAVGAGAAVAAGARSGAASRVTAAAIAARRPARLEGRVDFTGFSTEEGRPRRQNVRERDGGT
ncbi:hypothetical protein GCM10009809_02930 [Isoptericola hypogeus]|uniref:Uncharacterized protein n=1 Tax=Isoptericola hypogeus TaxID=300179 RepID=A0ABN2IQZ5_9MICO